jgi:hypothetical protein
MNMLGWITIACIVLVIICFIMIMITEEESTIKTVGKWGAGLFTIVAMGSGFFWWKKSKEEEEEEDEDDE